MKQPSKRSRWSILLPLAGALLIGSSIPCASAHLIGEEAHDHGTLPDDFSVKAPTRILLHNLDGVRGVIVLAATTPNPAGVAPTGQAGSADSTSARMAAAFAPFSPIVKTHADDQFLYVESGGLPAHTMMVGITVWQQQVPLPQAYTGNNAWRIPLHPVPAQNPISIKGRFLRGAIALAANGIPIFNPQNNRGEISQEIGELDEWGGHCGRADDYHYHAVPLHLQSVLGKGLPIAWALDGYPIYGLTEPDGSAPVKLDAFNGHETPGLGYHYHGSNKYPYVIGGFHGEVIEREGQVDPQPRARAVRRALPPLRGAKIIGFNAAVDGKTYSLQYSVNGQSAAVNYAVNEAGIWKFQYVSADGTTHEESYGAGGSGGDDRGRGAGRDGGPPPENNRPPPDRRAPGPSSERGVSEAPIWVPKRSGNMTLSSFAVASGGALPVEFTGDGESSTPPLEWTNGPVGTKSYAIIMHHHDPEGKTKWYWMLYNIPAEVHSLPKNVKGIGTLGNNSVNDRLGYAPPHSKGPGAKTYILTVYALSAPASISVPAAEVNRSVLLAAMKDLILDSAELKVTYDRTRALDGAGAPRQGE